MQSSTSFSPGRQRVGINEVDKGIRILSFMHDDYTLRSLPFQVNLRRQRIVDDSRSVRPYVHLPDLSRESKWRLVAREWLGVVIAARQGA